LKKNLFDNMETYPPLLEDFPPPPHNKKLRKIKVPYLIGRAGFALNNYEDFLFFLGDF
jgi:hypothetical protein